MAENYIVINGKRAELTKEQLKALGIESELERRNPCTKVTKGDTYYFASEYGGVESYTQTNDNADDALLKCYNYFNDDSVAQQVALHQLLYRKLLKFAYDNECEDTSEWGTHNQHWTIYYDCDDDKFVADSWDTFKFASVYFNSEDAADRAIKEIVQPFVKEHPDFKW